MFKANNFEPDEVQTQFFNKRICPDIESMKEFQILRNGYTSSKDRRSFNVQAALCDNTIDSNCASPEEIKFLLERLYFTFYIIEDNIQFGEMGQKPFLTVNKFHSQFQLDSSKYRDNNNFIKINKATTTESRNPLNSQPKDYYFVNSIINPVWISTTWKKPENITEDGGKTFFQATDELIFGAYFFLSDVQVIHKLNRYNGFSFLADLGGLLNTLVLSVSFFMIVYNGKATAISVIQNMYMQPTERVPIVTKGDTEKEGGDQE